MLLMMMMMLVIMLIDQEKKKLAENQQVAVKRSAQRPLFFIGDHTILAILQFFSARSSDIFVVLPFKNSTNRLH